MGVLRDTAAKIKNEFAVYRLVLKHPETPFLAKILLGLAVGYILLPFDLIPDFIPVVGHLDDLVIVPALIYAALKLVPKGIVESCRKELESTHG
ncbi:MAG: YkvA family protein [Methylophilaceae bacterium]|jgi:uncharacterized membrane protein YkvA (DUF1232 family)|nr:DUF1232 domain-containing protein [Methylophilaceae bacterium]